MQREQLRKLVFWFGWSVLIVVPLIFVAEAVITQDLPHVQPWKWAIPLAAALIAYAARNRDDVLHHHVV